MWAGKDLDALDPSGALIWADAPPFPSNLRRGAVRADRCEQDGREQRETNDERSHPSEEHGMGSSAVHALSTAHLYSQSSKVTGEPQQTGISRCRRRVEEILRLQHEMCSETVWRVTR